MCLPVVDSVVLCLHRLFANFANYRPNSYIILARPQPERTYTGKREEERDIVIIYAVTTLIVRELLVFKAGKRMYIVRKPRAPSHFNGREF